MHRRLILVALALLPLFLSAAAPSAGPATQAVAESKEVDKDGVAVTLVVPQATGPSDQQPEFVVRFKNVGTEDRNLYDVTAYWNWAIELTNTDPKAADPGPWRVQMTAVPGRANVDHRQIKPGESTDVAVNLNDPPFTFKYTYAGIMKHLVSPVRHLAAGHYRLTTTVKLTNPFGDGHGQWGGPVATEASEITITNAPFKPNSNEELGAYDVALARVTDKLASGGLWMNGRINDVKLPKDAALEDVLDVAINQASLGSKAYRVLRVQPFVREEMPGTATGSAALLRVGKAYKVVVLFPQGEGSWWTRFYDAEVTP